MVGLADLVDFIDVDDAALRAFQVEISSLQQLQEQVLNIFADVASLGQRGGVTNSERHIQDARKRLGQQRLAGTGGTDHQDVGLIKLDL